MNCFHDLFTHMKLCFFIAYQKTIFQHVTTTPASMYLTILHATKKNIYALNIILKDAD